MMKVYSRRQLMAKAPVPLEKQYLTFKALESGTFTLSQNAVSYSLDEGVTWNTLAAGTASPSVPAGKTIMWKGTITPGTTTGVGTFSATGSFNALGNAMSLLFGDNFARVKTLSGKIGAFYNLFLNNGKLVSAENLSLPALTMVQNGYRNMFQGCKSLVTAPALPATTLKDYCYNSMFRGCTSLTTAPELPATTLAWYCYGNMFYGCTSLTSTPELPATTLADSCYSNMFHDCTSLVNAPELPATTLKNYCYVNMFQGCTRLTKAPKLPATILTYYCYQYMFRDCTSLTTAPQLPATTLKNYCYYQMFQGCTRLNYIKAMFTAIPSSSCTENWVNGVASTGTFVKNSAATWDVTGISGIPSGWTVQTADE
jgi:hypothetical protein